MDDGAVEEDGAAELGGHVVLGVGEFRVSRRLRHEELTLLVVDDEWLCLKNDRSFYIFTVPKNVKFCMKNDSSFTFLQYLKT
jgi:hypothetical protein